MSGRLFECWQYLLCGHGGSGLSPGLQLDEAGASVRGPISGFAFIYWCRFVSSGICGGRDGFGFGIVGSPFVGQGRFPSCILRCMHFSAC